MTKFKKILSLMFLIVVVFVIAGCGSDKEAPVLEVSLENNTITHAVNEDVDFLQYVAATDNLSLADDIVIEISDYNGYDKSVEGTYEITIKATDKAGNFVTAKITVIVEEAGPTDTLAPTMTGAVTPVNHLAGEEVDLTKGLTGVDNVDGTSVTFTVSDYNDYNKDVPGTYTVKITISDSAGNVSQPYNRTIVVSESFARAEMVSFEGETIRFQALYNPQVLNGNTQTGYNTAYDGHYVNVLSKDYVEWLIEYAPERLGSGVGWSVIAVTDENEKIVYIRQWSSGEAFLEDGELVSRKGTDWSTGTSHTWNELVNGVEVTRTNAKYSTGEMGLMMANINQWIPEDGHVFIFMNWTTIGFNESQEVVTLANTSDMGRSMGANYIMNSDEDGDDVMDYALGRDLKIVDPELSHQTVRKSFDPENPFPIITIPSSKYVNDNGVWKSQYTETVYLNEYDENNQYNPLRGVVANDGKGNDITANITYKVYNFKTAQSVYGMAPSLPVTDPMWQDYFETVFVLSENEVTLDAALDPSHDGYYYVVEYTVTANGHTDTAYRLIQVAARTPDYIELYGESDSVYSEAMGLQQRLEFNPDLTEFGAFDQTDKGILFDASTFSSLETLPTLSKGVVVVLDNYYRIQVIRLANGAIAELDQAGAVKTDGLTWTASDLLAGLKDIVPTDGYVLLYPEGLEGAVINKALRAFYDYDYQGGELTEVTPANGMVFVELIIKDVQEVMTLVVNDSIPKISINGTLVNVEVVENNLQSLVFNPGGGGAGFRLETGKAYYYTKADYATLVRSTEVVDSFTNLSKNHGVPWLNNGVIVVLDADGKFVQARLFVGGAAEVKADGTVIFGNEAVTATTESAKAAAGEANLTWDLIVPSDANTAAHGPLADIESVIPDGGSFFIFPNSKNSTVRDLAIKLVWNNTYSSAGIVDGTLEEAPDNAATNGFDFTNYTATYFDGLRIESRFISTITVKPNKLTRPEVTIDNGVISWAKVEGAASYDVYANGVLVKSNVGTLSEDQTTYSYNLGLLELLVGEYDIQVRAITADATKTSTSVLSDAVRFNSEKLATPTNLVLTEKLLSWDAVEGAASYKIFVNDVEFGVADTNQFDLTDAFGSSKKFVKVKAMPSETSSVSASDLSEPLAFGETNDSYLVMGLDAMHITYTTVDEWMTKRNDAFSALPELFLIEDAYNFTTFDQDALVTQYASLVVFDQDGNVKAVRTVTNNHEWLATNDANVNNGWTINSSYTAGKIFVKEFSQLLVDGDYIIVTNTSSVAPEGSRFTPRNFLAYYFAGSWEVGSSEIWRQTVLDNFINPTTASFEVKVFPKEYYMKLNDNQIHFTYTTVSEWMTKRNDAFSSLAEIFYIEDAYNYTTFDQNALITKNATFLLFDKYGNLKAVRTIINKFEWLATNDPATNNGWVDKTEYTNGGFVYVKEVTPLLAEGDYIILTNSTTTKPEGSTLNPRDFLANSYQAPWNAGESEAWRGTIDTFINPLSVAYTVVEKVIIVTPLAAPTNLVLTDKSLAWDAVEGASSYNIYVGGVEVATASTNSFDLTPFFGSVKNVQVQAVPSATNKEVSALSEAVSFGEALVTTLGSDTVSVVTHTVATWMGYAAYDIGAAQVPGIVLITDANNIANLADDAKVFNGGNVVLLGSDGKAKLVISRWGHIWTAANGENPAVWTKETLAWGLNIFASYIKSHLAEGDMLLMGGQYGVGADHVYRDYIGIEYINTTAFGAYKVDNISAATADPTVPTFTYGPVVSE